MLILAIETSCDETAVALVRDGQQVLCEKIFTQIPLHNKTNGIVPEVAARAHIPKIIPLIKAVLVSSNTTISSIDALAVTQGPGLIGSLLVGIITARSLANIWQKPLIPVHHIAGHIYANTLNQAKPFTFPFLVLTVSGGHNEIILVQSHTKFKIIGTTLDDSAGEAFDKTAKLLDLVYPGGPIISKLAQDYHKNPQSYDFHLPRPLLKKRGKNYDFSFSGLKTAVKIIITKQKLKTPQLTAKFSQAIAYEFQNAVTETLTTKIIQAALDLNITQIHLTGGVSANTQLRTQLQTLAHKYHLDLHIPAPQFSTDNASMIGARAYFFWQNAQNRIKYHQEIKPQLQIF